MACAKNKTAISAISVWPRYSTRPVSQHDRAAGAPPARFIKRRMGDQRIAECRDNFLRPALPIDELDLKHRAGSIDFGGGAAIGLGSERCEHEIDGPRRQTGARSLLRRVSQLFEKAANFVPRDAAAIIGEIRHKTPPDRGEKRKYPVRLRSIGEIVSTLTPLIFTNCAFIRRALDVN
jgi:hypothetical protein